MAEEIKLPQKKERHPGGRPKKTLADLDLPEDWKEIMVEMSANGCSETEIRAKIMLSQGKQYKHVHAIWLKIQEREIEFREAVSICKQLAEAWWLERGRTGMMHSSFEKFESFVWFKNMQNRFGWQDKVDLEIALADQTVEKLQNETPDQLAERASRLLGHSTGKVIDTIAIQPDKEADTRDS